jgi:hypothetical protein
MKMERAFSSETSVFAYKTTGNVTQKTTIGAAGFLSYPLHMKKEIRPISKSDFLITSDDGYSSK